MLEVEKTIEQWQKLQRLIKEEITLSKIIKEDQKIQAEKFQEWYFDYYHTRIQIDYQFKENDFRLNRNVDEILDEAYNPVYELLMRFRQDESLIMMLIDIIEKNDYMKHSSMDDLIQLFCFHFYDDILTSNNDEVALSLISKMIEREVSHISSLKPSTFIDESTSFLGKFLRYYALKQDFTHFVSIIFGGVLLKINQYDRTFELNPRSIAEYAVNHADTRTSCMSLSMSRISRIEDITNASLTNSIKRSCFNVDNHKMQLCVSYKIGDDIFFQNKSNSNDIIFNTLAQIDDEHKNSVFKENKDYQIELTESELLSRIQNKETSKELRELYSRHVCLGNDYTNQVFITELNSFKSSAKIILYQYRKNYNLIKDAIDSILKNLITNIHSIPYSLRCICKMISEEIKKKYPKMSTLERNSFIGEFFFRKCLTNFVILEQNSKKIKDSCLNISKVLQKISRCSLFSSEYESHYTMFNHYIIEIIPKIHEVYDKLIDVEVNYSPIENSKICIVFSIEAILMFNTILIENKNLFESLPNNKFYTKTINRIKNQETNLKRIVSRSKLRNFFAIFNWDRAPNLKNSETEIQLNEIENGSSNKVAQVKFCIKSILKGLNIVNKKIYSHLNNATSNENFILALNEIIQLEEYNVNNSDNYLKNIPLSWYSLYMTSNLWKDNNDFQSLYDELFKEERDKFKVLENQYNEITIDLGITERSVLNKLEKNKKILIRKNHNYIIGLAKKIVDLTPLSICMRRIEPTDNQEAEKKNAKAKTMLGASFWRKANPQSDKNLIHEALTHIQLTEKAQCIHQRLKLLNSIGDLTSNKTKYYHTHTIKQFATQLCCFDEVHGDILKGNNDHHVYTTIKSAISFIEKELSNPSPITTTQSQDGNQGKDYFKNEDLSIQHFTPGEKVILNEYIEDFILKKIHKQVCLSIVLEKDTKLFNALIKLSYLSQKDLAVQNNSINETLSQLAAEGLNTIDSKMTPREKLKVIASSFEIINNSIKYSLEKDDSNTINPVIRYILLKATPKRLHCNINFIRAFTDASNLRGELGLMLYQLEAAASFFLNFEEKAKHDDRSN